MLRGIARRVRFPCTSVGIAKIIEHTLVGPEITGPLEQASPGAGVLGFDLTLDDLDELLGSIAAEANHCRSKKLEKELDGLYDRVKDVMESYDDGRWPD